VLSTGHEPSNLGKCLAREREIINEDLIIGISMSIPVFPGANHQYPTLQSPEKKLHEATFEIAYSKY
jgi:hypothetical protein